MTPALFRLASLCVLGAACAGCSTGTYPPRPSGLPYVDLASYPSPIPPTTIAPGPAAMPAPPPDATVPDGPMARQDMGTTASAHRPSGLPGLQHVDLASYPSPIPATPAAASGVPKAAARAARTAPSRPAVATIPETPAARSLPWTPPAITRSNSYAQDMERMRRIEEEARRDSDLRVEAMAREMERERRERERQREQDRLEQEYREAALRDQLERDRRYHQEREQERERERDREREQARRDHERRDHANRDQERRDQARREQAERDRRAEEERRNRETRPAPQMAPGSYTPDRNDWRARQNSNSREQP